MSEFEVFESNEIVGGMPAWCEEGMHGAVAAN